MDYPIDDDVPDVIEAHELAELLDTPEHILTHEIEEA